MLTKAQVQTVKQGLEPFLSLSSISVGPGQVKMNVHKLDKNELQKIMVIADENQTELEIKRSGTGLVMIFS